MISNYPTKMAVVPRGAFHLCRRGWAVTQKQAHTMVLSSLLWYHSCSLCRRIIITPD